MGQVIIHEYSDLKRDIYGNPTAMAKGVLATDEIAAITGIDQSVKTVTTISGTPVDSVSMTGKTNFVIIGSSSDVYYRVRPKSFVPGMTFDARLEDRKIPAGSETIEAVYPGAIISFLEA